MIYPEEIRPRWDWKLEATKAAWEEYIKKKSDQGGIESFFSCSSRLGLMGRNQTKVGLKVSFNYSFDASNWSEEIRPRWDWKLHSL